MTTLHPDLFDPKNISDETDAFNSTLEKLIASMPPTYNLEPEKLRADREAGNGLWKVKRLDTLKDRIIPAKTGDVAVRIFVPPKVDGIYLHIHGGGFMLGRAHHWDVANVRLAESCNLVVVSVDYRLAPEDPHPAAADDCEAVAFWLINNAKKEFGSDFLVIGGESAGANLAVVTILRMRDKFDFKSFAAANLVFGVYDINSTPSARNWGETPKLVLTTKLMEWFHQKYAPEEKRFDPDVSPLYADLADMPPALFTIGTRDPLLDDSLFMHARWVAAGNQAELAIYPGGIHTFTAFPIALARQANTHIFDFINGTLAIKDFI